MTDTLTDEQTQALLAASVALISAVADVLESHPATPNPPA